MLTRRQILKGLSVLPFVGLLARQDPKRVSLAFVEEHRPTSAGTANWRIHSSSVVISGRDDGRTSSLHELYTVSAEEQNAMWDEALKLFK